MRASDKSAAVTLAMGRILRLASRATQPGDVEEYERCRALILDVLEPPPFAEHRPNYARDRRRGAPGD